MLEEREKKNNTCEIKVKKNTSSYIYVCVCVCVCVCVKKYNNVCKSGHKTMVHDSEKDTSLHH